MGYYVKEKNLAIGRKHSLGIDMHRAIRHEPPFKSRMDRHRLTFRCCNDQVRRDGRRDHIRVYH